MVTRHSVGGGMATGKKTEDLRGKFKKGGGMKIRGKPEENYIKTGVNALKMHFKFSLQPASTNLLRRRKK